MNTNNTLIIFSLLCYVLVLLLARIATASVLPMSNTHIHVHLPSTFQHVAYEKKVHCASEFITNAEETVRILRNLHGMTSSLCLVVSTTAAWMWTTTNLFLRYYFQQMDVVIHYGIMASQHYHITYGDYTNGQQAVFIIVYRR